MQTSQISLLCSENVIFFQEIAEDKKLLVNNPALMRTNKHQWFCLMALLRNKLNFINLMQLLFSKTSLLCYKEIVLLNVYYW